MRHSVPFIAIRIAAEELRLLWRKRVAASGFVLLCLLTLAAAMVSLMHRQAEQADRARFQATAQQHWDAQPDRHPHRVVHYGHFVFRPLEPLSFFDFGVEPYTGRAIIWKGTGRTPPTSATRASHPCCCASAS